MPPRPSGNAMAAPDRDVEMGNYHYSSSPDLSSLPSDSPSEPGSPSRNEQGRPSLGPKSDEIVVDAPAAPRFALAPQQQAPQRQQTPQYSADGVRLNKDGLPRKKPGRKPGSQIKKANDGTTTATAHATAAGSGVEAAKVRRPRKPRDPNAPPVQRKKRTQPTSALAAAESSPTGSNSRSVSGDIHFPPKIELTSMRMDIDARPNPPPPPSSVLAAPSSVPQPPRQPPLSQVDKMPKREGLPSSMQSILNVDDSPPRPPLTTSASTTPVRSIGQNYDPVRSSNYDPVRETMRSRDPYGTGPLGSPRAPAQIPNRASASPSIASLVDPAPLSISRSPVASSTAPLQTSPPPFNSSLATSNRYRDGLPSHPSSPSSSPAIHNIMSSSSSSRQLSSTTKAPSSQPPAKTLPPAPSSVLTSKPSTSKTPPAPSSVLTSESKSGSGSGSSSVPTTTTKAATSKSETKKEAKNDSKSDANGHKHHDKPPPPSSVISSTKAASKTSTKSTSQKPSAAKAIQSSESTTSSKPSGPVTTSFRDVAVSGAGSNGVSATTTPLIKKFSSVLQQQERGGKQNKSATGSNSSPKLSGQKSDASLPADKADVPPINGTGNGVEPERSILDFGKVRPGEEANIPSIVLHIPLIQGENNKYVNFMRMAEDRYGWDALHPRLAAHRDRKARIAAASAALERNGSGRESGDEMTDDMNSGDEGSNEEGAGAADNGTNGVNASGPDEGPAKPVRKKRVFKEDEYDKDDDFVDDSEMLWEEQAAASRDGFFVYSGPLVPEEEKPASGTPPAKRGRGSRGGRGGASRSTASRTTTGRATGPGSRGGTTTRKPRATKQEKEQREREKAEQEKAGHAAASKLAASSFNLLGGTNTPFTAGMAVDA